MRNVQLAAAWVSVIVGMGMALVAYAAWPVRHPRFQDLAIDGLTSDVDPDRRVTVHLDIRNRGGDDSAPAWLFVQWLHDEHRDVLSPLPPGATRSWTWRSTPLPPGDHELTISIEPRSSELDRAVVQRQLLHVPSPGVADGRGSLPMPPLIGLTREAAARELRRDHLPAPNWYERRGRIAVDRVAQQWPRPGRTFPRSDRPVLVLAAATTVPDVGGVSLDRARDRLRDAGLTIDSTHVTRSGRFGVESVTAQSPAPGAQVDLDSAVTLGVVEPLPVTPFAIAGSLVVIGLLLAPRPRFRRGPARDHDAPLEPFIGISAERHAAAPPLEAMDLAAPRGPLGVALATPRLVAREESPAETAPFAAAPVTRTPAAAEPIAIAELGRVEERERSEPLATPEREPVAPMAAASIGANHGGHAAVRFIPEIDPGLQVLTCDPETEADALQLLIVPDPGRQEVRWRW